MKQKEKNIILSVCLTCNNTSEENSKICAGQRLASNLKDAFKAHKLMESSKHLGKIVLRIK